VSSGSAAKVTGDPGSFLGTNVGMGDWNGDGIQDFAVGAWEANANQTGSLYSFAGSIAKLTQSYTVGNDTLTAGGSSTGAPSIVNGVDRLSGGLGDDVITGIGTDTTGTTATSTLHDVAYGGAGNDTISLAGLNLTRADGGQGTDTLKLAGSALDLDLATYGTRIHGFEKFDLGAGGAADANTLRLRLSDVLNEPESTATLGHLEIKGDSSDALYLTNGSTGTWASTGTTSANGDTYTIYHHSTMAAGNTLGDVWVQLGMQVNQV
jgi:hypothetical protein